jgi:hypothetical protein
MIKIQTKKNATTHSMSIAEFENTSVSIDYLHLHTQIFININIFPAEEPEKGIDPKCYRANGFFNHDEKSVCDR